MLLPVDDVMTDLSFTPAAAWPALLSAQHAMEDLGACSVEEHVDASFEALQELVWADRTSIMMVVRVDADDSDALAGWRLAWLYSPGSPRFSRFIRPLARLLTWTDEQREGFRSGNARAGAVHCVGPNAPASHRRFNTLIGVAHRLIAAIPISSTIEVFFAFNRKEQGFSKAEVATSLAAAHVFQRLSRRWCAQLGILDGCVLSPRERQVLTCLLQGVSEKAGAEQLGMKPSYFHQIVVRIYGKLNVDSRGSLLTKCFKAPASDKLWDAKTMMSLGQTTSTVPKVTPGDSE